MVSYWLGELPAVCPTDKLCVLERTGNALAEAEIPGFEVQAPGSNLVFLIIVRA